MQINDQLLDIDGITKSKKPLLELFIRRTAVITSTPEHLVEKIIKDQWNNANKVSQSTSDISEIEFCNLGTFFISKSKAKKRIARLLKAQATLESLGPELDLDEKLQNRRDIMKVKNLETVRIIKLKTKQNECQAHN